LPVASKCPSWLILEICRKVVPVVFVRLEGLPAVLK